MREGLLRLSGIELGVVIGVLPEERMFPRLVKVDVECRGGWAPGDPPLVDYRSVAGAVGAHAGSAFDLIEDLAGALLASLRPLAPGCEWTVTVGKPCPPVTPRAGEASFRATSG